MKAHIFRILSVLLIAALLPVTALAAEQRTLASNLIRLHVIANSDSERDQSLKLIVRDAVLDATADISECELEGSLDDIRFAAELALRSNGCDSPVRVLLGYEEYGTREYDSFSLPAGRYRSLRVEIGDAAGHNWWCVLFPPLCFASAEEVIEQASAFGMSEEAVELITEDSQDVQICFRLLELLQELAHFLF